MSRDVSRRGSQAFNKSTRADKVSEVSGAHNELMDKVFEESSIGIITETADGEISVNTGFRRLFDLFGLCRSRLCSEVLNYLNCRYFLNSPSFGKFIDEAFISSQSIKERFFETSDGRHIQADCIKSAEGTAWVFRDITEVHKRIEADTSVLISAFDTETCGMWDWDVASGKVFYSPGWLDIYGTEKNTMADTEQWFRAIHPKDRDMVRCKLDIHLEGLTDSYYSEYRISRKGSTVWVQDRGKVIRRAEDGSPVRIVGMQRDITESKNLELATLKNKIQMEKAQEIASLGSWQLDVKNGVLNWSDEVYRIFGIEKTDTPVSYEMFLDFVHPDDREKVMFEYEKSVLSGNNYDIVHRIVRPDGECRIVREICEDIYDGAGGVSYSIGIVQDITDYKETENQLKELNAKLFERVEAETVRRVQNEQIMFDQQKFVDMAQMLSAIAHQWRQPLNVLGLQIQELQDVYDENMLDRKFIESFIDVNMSMILNLSSTIDEFRSFFHPSSEKENFDVVDTLTSIINIVKAKLLSDKIHFSFSCSCSDGEVRMKDRLDISSCSANKAYVESYKGEFKQVLMHLIQNSADAVSERISKQEIESGVIHFGLKVKGGQISITVEDNGGGVAPQAADKLFDPFFSTKERNKATGIGLYMAKVIICDHMNGEITHKNTDDGVQFILELPLSTNLD